MLITAKLTRLKCFVNNVLQLCLILDNFFNFVAYALSQAVKKSPVGCKGAYALSELSHLMRS